MYRKENAYDRQRLNSMNNENKSNVLGNIYDDVVCAYACPSTEWNPEPFDPPIEVIPKDDPSPIKFGDTKVGPDYIISGDVMTFYGVNTLEKRLKMIELFEELKNT